MNIVFKKLDHLQICIPRGMEDRAREFYTDILGLTEIPKPAQLLVNGGLWYQIADIQLHIGTDTKLEKSKAHPAFEITGSKEVRDYLAANGVIVQNEIPIDGQERFSFRDPFGNRIEFLERTT